MNTPIADFVKGYIDSNTARLHMPGHKGASFLGCEQFDITEIKGADELFCPEGIILESEKNASSLFGTARTVYSAGGSSQSINAMVFLALSREEADKTPLILAGRNAHKAFIYAAAKLDADIEWIYPESCQKGICSCIITADTLEKAIKSAKKKPSAVYITSPDYLGGISDIEKLSAVCKRHGIPLLVDNAHGAYTAFLENNMHPMHLGADLCCDSAHKTLPVLTGGGYLHIAKSDSFGFSESAVRAMEIFGSTSPSYLIMQSLDICNKYLAEGFKSDLAECINKTARVKEEMKAAGIPDASSEPVKITADFSRFKEIDGGFAEHFRKLGVECEYSDGEFVVFMTSPQNKDEDYERLIKAFRGLGRLETKEPESSAVFPGKKAVSVRKAVFSPCYEISADNALGKICGAPTVSCPPAIPIAVSGEVINESHIKLFRRYGINKIVVIK